MRQIAVAVHSDAEGELGQKIERFVKRLSEICPDALVLVGGYWGYMKEVVDHALGHGLKVVAFLPIEKEWTALPPGVMAVRSGCEYRCRSVLLVRSSDAVVVLGGGVGTAIEAFMAYAMGRPLYVLTNSGMPTDRLSEAYPEYFDERKAVRIVYTTEPELLAELACRAERPAARDFG